MWPPRYRHRLVSNFQLSRVESGTAAARRGTRASNRQDESRESGRAGEGDSTRHSGKQTLETPTSLESRVGASLDIDPDGTVPWARRRKIQKRVKRTK